MSTHNIGFYEEISKIILIIIKYHQLDTLSLDLSVVRNYNIKSKMSESQANSDVKKYLYA